MVTSKQGRSIANIETSSCSSSASSKRAKTFISFKLAWLGNGIYHSTMVYRQKVELAYFSNACEPFGRLALHGSVQLNPPI
jgi:hypothetical protein